MSGDTSMRVELTEIKPTSKGISRGRGAQYQRREESEGETVRLHAARMMRGSFSMAKVARQGRPGTGRFDDRFAEARQRRRSRDALMPGEAFSRLSYFYSRLRRESSPSPS